MHVRGRLAEVFTLSMFHHVGYLNQTQVLRVNSSYSHSLSRLASPIYIESGKSIPFDYFLCMKIYKFHKMYEISGMS